MSTIFTDDEDDSIEVMESRLFEERTNYNETSDRGTGQDKTVLDDIANVLENRNLFFEEKSETDKTENNLEDQQQDQVNIIKIQHTYIEYFQRYINPVHCFCVATVACVLIYLYDF